MGSTNVRERRRQRATATQPERRVTVGGYKRRQQQDGKEYGEITRIDVWCGNNDAIEHRQNWDSRKTSYFFLSYSFSAEREEQPWGFAYGEKFLHRLFKRLDPGGVIYGDSPEVYLPQYQARQSVYANVPKWIPENSGSFIWKCPRCKRVYQLNMKILRPYLDDLRDRLQTRVSAAHLEAIQAEILRAKQDEATGNNRP